MKLNEKELEEITDKVTKKLVKRKMIIQADRLEMEKLRERLRKYFREGETDAELEKAMKDIKKDTYFCVLKKQYGEGATNEEIAEEMRINVRTVYRHKKKLLSQLFLELYE